ncbi:hypothetical protein D1007_19144 [Hordeum vulgare]|nr:hypothetical protein D1007_19144 [Hordeum vulgare]
MGRSRVRRRAGAAIADDVLRDVFARLPGYQDLLRCAATCKRWFRLITDPAFLRHFVSLGAGGAHLTFNSFVDDDDDDGVFNLARPVASRRGFLLARAVLPEPEKLRLAVCRPLVDRRDTHLLPEPPLDLSPSSLNRDTGWAILTSADNGDDGYAYACSDDRRQSTFQVLLIYTDDDGVMYTCSYSSSLRIWSAPTERCRASHLTRCGPRAGVVTHGGTAYWLYSDSASFYALGVSSATAHASLTKIPIEFRHDGLQPPLLCTVGGGSISFVNIREHGMLELWTKQEEDAGSHADHGLEGGWLRSELADLGNNKRINLVFFAEKRGALLVQQGRHFFTIDLRSKERLSVEFKDKKSRRQATKYKRWTHCTSTWCSGISGRMCYSSTPVLYEMDCVF